VRGNYETGNQAFSMHLRFLTIRDCKCYGSFSESDLKRIEETASCAISIYSSFLTIRGITLK
jgi:hypothetical protein